MSCIHRVKVTHCSTVLVFPLVFNGLRSFEIIPLLPTVSGSPHGNTVEHGNLNIEQNRRRQGLLALFAATFLPPPVESLAPPDPERLQARSQWPRCR